MDEIKHKTSVTVETVDGTYRFDLARIKAHVDSRPAATYEMTDESGERVPGGELKYDAKGLKVKIEGGVLAVCAVVEGPINGGSHVVSVDLPVFEFSPSYWTVYSFSDMPNLKQFLRD